MWIILGVIFILLIILVTMSSGEWGGGNFPWMQFYAKGRESGFSMKEIHLLRKVAVENRLENPDISVLVHQTAGSVNSGEQ